MSNKACSIVHCVCLVVCQLCIWWSLLMENFTKLVLVSHTAFSLWVYITCLHEGTLPPRVISLKTLHFQKMCVLFVHQETVPFDHIWNKWCRRKMTSSMTGSETTEQHFDLFLCKSVRTSGHALLLSHSLTSIMTDIHHIMLQQRGCPPLKQQQGWYVSCTLYIRLLQSPHFDKKGI